MTSTIHVEVVYALPHLQIIKSIAIPDDCSVAQAIRYSGILEQFPEIDLTHNKLGIFGRFTNLGALLRHNDRIEIYRPLIIDPKEARRIRASKTA